MEKKFKEITEKFWTGLRLSKGQIDLRQNNETQLSPFMPTELLKNISEDERMTRNFGTWLTKESSNISYSDMLRNDQLHVY